MAGIFVMCLEVGVLLSFALGTYMFSTVGFRMASDIVGGVYIITFVVLVIHTILKGLKK